MKRKRFILVLLSALALVACAVCLAACGGNSRSGNDGTHEHKYINYAYNDDATCVADGTETAKCEYCKETDTRIKSGTATGTHTFTDYVYDDNATCVDDGTETAKCLYCEETDTQTVADTATGIHAFKDYVYNDDATCTSDGTETAECEHCKETDTQTVPKSAAHKYDDYVCLFCNSVATDAPVTDDLKYREVVENGELVGYTVMGAESSHKYIKIPGVYLNKSVIGIEDEAFYYSNLICIEIPDSIISIGRRVFYNCSSLTSVTIGNSVTSIGGSAFYNCISLTSIDIPKSVTSIGDYAFYGCRKLARIFIPKSVTSIGGSAFDQCNIWIYCEHEQNPWGLDWKSMTAKSVGDGIIYVPNMTVIWDCNNNVADLDGNIYEVIDGIIYSIKDGEATVMRHVNDIEGDITLPSTIMYNNREYVVTSIRSYAFYDCIGITSIEIPNGVTSVGSYAFKNCSGLTSVEIPDSVTSIGSYAFNGCNNIIQTESGAKYVNKWIIEYESSATSVVLRADTVGIADRVFYNCSDLTSIEIPNGVTSIGSYAFYGCSGLMSIKIPSGVTSIGINAFNRCTNLEEISLPDSITTIEDSMFNYCTSLTSIEIPSSVTSIGAGVFYGCSGLTSIKIPNSVTSIGSSAFYNCTGLTSISIPNSITNVGYNAFDECSKLKYYTYNNGYYLGNSNNNYVIFVNVTSNSVTSCTFHPDTRFICSFAFDGCKEYSFKSLTIPDKVVGIGGEAFNIQYLSSISFGKGIEKINSFIFKQGCCLNVTTVSVSKDNPKYYSKNNCIIEKENKKLVLAVDGSILPTDGSIEIIGNGAYYYRNLTTEIAIPNTVTKIEQGAIASFRLTTITIPSSVVYIERNAFLCPNLTIYCEAESKPTGWNCEWNHYLSDRYYGVVWDYKNK